MSLVEQLTALNEPTMQQVNVLLESVQSLHNKTRKEMCQIIKETK